MLVAWTVVVEVDILESDQIWNIFETRGNIICFQIRLKVGGKRGVKDDAKLEGGAKKRRSFLLGKMFLKNQQFAYRHSILRCLLDIQMNM